MGAQTGKACARSDQDDRARRVVLQMKPRIAADAQLDRVARLCNFIEPARSPPCLAVVADMGAHYEFNASVDGQIGDRIGARRPIAIGHEEIDEALGLIKPGQVVVDLGAAPGAWSQYLEVGIGPDAEIFTKAPTLAAVGCGADAGMHPASQWNNPEPEVVLTVNSRGQVVGATLGNDVNLRDVEGRSALLLGKAKDNNASAAIGPFIRLFDSGFGIDDVRQAELSLRVGGEDGFVMDGYSSMSKISRDPLALVAQLMGPHHQYPDGAMLFLGTLFAPTQDRDAPGGGFTHKLGDTVTISSPKLGTLRNRMQHTDQCPPWNFGLAQLMRNLAQRGLLSQ